MKRVEVMKQITVDSWLSEEKRKSIGPIKTYQRLHKKMVSISQLKQTECKSNEDNGNNVENGDVEIGKNIRTEKRILGCLSCGICTFKTNGPAFMKAHMEKHSRKKMVICDKCFCRFNSKKELVVHIKKVHVKLRFKCNMYKCSSRSKSILRKQIDSHKDVNNMKTKLSKNESYDSLICNICGYKFDKEIFLRKHMKLHKGGTAFLCRVCENPFRNSDDMKRIEDTENGLMQFQCICKNKYTLKNAIEAKLVLSDGERPFECDKCSCKFRFPHLLSIHVKVHSDLNPYKCKFCTNSYRFMAHLKSHSIVHKFL